MADRPIIYRDPADTGISGGDFYRFGKIGELNAITIHHSAGPRAVNKDTARRLNRSYNAQHINQDWGAIGYHLAMDDHGRLYKLRPFNSKGAHVGGNNTGNLGIMVHGNYMHHKLTKAQRETLRWLLTGGIFQLTGVREREIAVLRGHREWPGHDSNACPGTHIMRHLNWLRDHHFH